MWSFLRKPRRSILIDIDSGSVGSCILSSRDTDTLPRLAHMRREYLPVSLHERTEAQHVYLLARMLAAAIRRLLRTAPDARSVAISSAAPWMQISLQTARTTDDAALTITPQLIRHILAQVQYPGRTAGYVPVRTSAVSVLCDEDPWHADIHPARTAASVEVACVHEHMHTRIAELAQSEYASATLYARARVLHHVLGELYPHAHHLSIIDIADEATEITTIEDGAFRAWYALPYGSATFIRNVAGASGTIPEEVHMYLRRSFGRTSMPERMQDAYACVSHEYRTLLSRADEQYSAAPYVCIVNDHPSRNPIADVIRAAHAGADIAEITPEYAYDLSERTDDIEPPDLRLAALASFVRTQHTRSDLEQSPAEMLY